MLPLRAIYHSYRLSERIPISVSPTLADACLVSYPSFRSTDSYRHATAVSDMPFDSSQRADSNGVLPDSIRPLADEIPFILYVLGHFLLPECLLLWARDMLPLRAIYHSNRLSERILMRCFTTRSDCWLWSHLPFCVSPDTFSFQNFSYRSKSHTIYFLLAHRTSTTLTIVYRYFYFLLSIAVVYL